MRLSRLRVDDAMSVDEALSFVCAICLDAFHARRAAYLSVDARRGRASIRTVVGDRPEGIARGQVPLPADLLAQLETHRVLDGKVLFPLDVDADIPPGNSAVLVSCFAGGSLTGIVSIELGPETAPLDAAHLDFAATLGDFASLVLAQAKRRELEAALAEQRAQRVEAEKYEALGRMASAVAHDFNNVLTVMLAVADLVEMFGGPESQRASAALLGASDSGRRMVASLLDYATAGRDSRGRTEVVSFVRAKEDFLRDVLGKRIVLVAEYEVPEAAIALSEAALERVLVNLASNAREAIGDRDGNVRVVVGAAKPNDVAGTGAIEIRFEDDGPGIDATVASRIFEPYFTTKTKGHGLGLSGSHATLRAVGGSIRVDTTLARGTRFLMTIPLALA